MHMTHMTVKNMPCRADPSRNVMSMNKGVSKIQLRMKTHVLPFFSKCSPFQKPTQTKKKTWTLTPHDLYLPMPSQAWLPASLRPGRGCKEKIRKATNPNGRWWHRDSHTTCHSHWIVTKSWHLYPSSGSTTLAPWTSPQTARLHVTAPWRKIRQRVFSGLGCDKYIQFIPVLSLASPTKTAGQSIPPYPTHKTSPHFLSHRFHDPHPDHQVVNQRNGDPGISRIHGTTGSEIHLFWQISGHVEH